MSKRMFCIGKIGPAFRQIQKVDVTDYTKDACNSILATAIAVILAVAGSAGLVLLVSMVEAWIMKGK